MKKIGRPLKYKMALIALEDEEIYAPYSIAGLVIEKRIYCWTSEEEKKELRKKIRHTMARYAKNNNFPEAGDGMVEGPGQSVQRGWKGKRWKQGV